MIKTYETRKASFVFGLIDFSVSQNRINGVCGEIEIHCMHGRFSDSKPYPLEKLNGFARFFIGNAKFKDVSHLLECF